MKFLYIFLILLLNNCITYGLFDTPSKTPKEELTRISPTGLIAIFKIDDKDFNKNLKIHWTGHLGSANPQGDFYIKPGEHKFNVSYREYFFKNGRQYLRFHDKILNVNLPKGQLVNLCHHTDNKSEKNDYIITARIFKYPDDFKPPIYIPYLSGLGIVGNGCDGSDPNAGKIIATAVNE